MSNRKDYSYEKLNEVFILDSSSPSGLSWKEDRQMGWVERTNFSSKARLPRRA